MKCPENVTISAVLMQNFHQKEKRERLYNNKVIKTEDVIYSLHYHDLIVRGWQGKIFWIYCNQCPEACSFTCLT